MRRARGAFLWAMALSDKVTGKVENIASDSGGTVLTVNGQDHEMRPDLAAYSVHNDANFAAFTDEGQLAPFDVVTSTLRRLTLARPCPAGRNPATRAEVVAPILPQEE